MSTVEKQPEPDARKAFDDNMAALRDMPKHQLSHIPWALPEKRERPVEKESR